VLRRCVEPLNRTMGHGAAIGLAVASSFGGTWGILRLPDMQRRMAATASLPTIYLTLNAAWCVAAGVVAIGFLVFIGPGLG
jgi:multisubunit Na+/H+ antiporter MnhG subunit